jgi:hypothetical protein
MTSASGALTVEPPPGLKFTVVVLLKFGITWLLKLFTVELNWTSTAWVWGSVPMVIGDNR